MDNNMLIDDRELKAIAVDILSEIDRICKVHNLTYALMFGTLLGAVRHRGFIPWDDDIDIAMPIKDYKKLIEIFNTECKEKYFLQSSQKDKNYWLAYAKVRRIDTLFAEKNSRKTKGSQGIFVDIFPMYYTEDIDSTYISEMIKKYQSRVAVACLKQRLDVDFGKKAFIKAKIIPRSATKWLKKAVEGFSEKESDYYFIPGMDASPKATNKYVFAKSDILPVEQIEFENKLFYGPKEKIKVLTRLYGDFMQLPPIEQRVSNHNTDEIRYLTKDEQEKAIKQINRGE